ncbi:rhodanese-related sulfurtransferase [Constrictibacter sp. MBR-5]|jgi:rhodanese-related sulfurtransferase|uniref:rhodanese family protein n=1 Tax=Constrictibacter sp. MBR-5 TaxID=3156467 RepID=UPI003396D53C
MQPVTPAQANALMQKGALLIDVREPDEHAREHIPGSHLAPLSRIDSQALPSGAPLVFLCRSGARTAASAGRLAAAAGGEAYLLEGGLEAWKRAGLPIEVDTRRPLELMRQVQIAAGSLALTGAILGFAVDPLFHLLSGFVGAGLIFAGVTGWCGMARLLMLAPWNRSAAA